MRCLGLEPYTPLAGLSAFTTHYNTANADASNVWIGFASRIMSYGATANRSRMNGTTARNGVLIHATML